MGKGKDKKVEQAKVPTPLEQLNALLAEEDDWYCGTDQVSRFDAGDDVRNVLSYGTSTHWGKGESEWARSFEGGHWAFDADVKGPAGYDAFWPDRTERATRIIELIEALTREALTELALSLSCCPIHFGDYASCFDDDEDECRAIRLIHPSHDT